MVNGTPQQSDISSSPSDPAVPTLSAVLKVFDQVIDDFNGHDDPGPLADPLYVRRALWRKSAKYICEDLNECLDLFYDLAYQQALDIRPSKLPALRVALKHGVALLGAQTSADYLARCEASLDRYPDRPLHALREEGRGGLWLRLAAHVDPKLPAPWPILPMAMALDLKKSQKNFRGASESWTDENHEDGIAGRKALLRAFEKMGWDYHLHALSEKDRAAIGTSNDLALARCGIRRVGPKEVSMDFDPVAGRWRTCNEIMAEIPAGKDGFKAYTTYKQVLQRHPTWTPAECDIASRFLAKMQSPGMELPPKPSINPI